MNPTNEPTTHSLPEGDNKTNQVSSEEKKAINYVKGIKEFYGHLGMYIFFMLAFFITGKFNQTPDSSNSLMWLSIGWGAGVIIHGLVAFEIFGSFGTQWEKKQIEKKLGRKL